MAKPKSERNQLFIEDWQRGLGNEDLGKKYDLSLGGVKALKQRLRAKDPSLYAEKRPGLTKVEKEVAQASGGLVKFAGKKTSKPAIQQVGKQEKKLTSKDLYKTATFYITEEQRYKLKLAALEQNKEISQLVREILSEYFNKH
ncbi:hypothetical protein ES702_06797 [subsurface metagenome]